MNCLENERNLNFRDPGMGHFSPGKKLSHIFTLVYVFVKFATIRYSCTLEEGLPDTPSVRLHKNWHLPLDIQGKAAQLFHRIRVTWSTNLLAGRQKQDKSEPHKSLIQSLTQMRHAKLKSLLPVMSESDKLPPNNSDVFC